MPNVIDYSKSGALKDDRNYGVPIFPDTDALKILDVDPRFITAGYLEGGKLIIAYHDDTDVSINAVIVENCLSETPTVGTPVVINDSSIPSDINLPLDVVVESASKAWLLYSTDTAGAINMAELSISGSTITDNGDTNILGMSAGYRCSRLRGKIMDGGDTLAVVYAESNNSTPEPIVNVVAVDISVASPTVSSAATVGSTSSNDFHDVSLVKLTSDRLLVGYNDSNSAVYLFSGFDSNTPALVDSNTGIDSYLVLFNDGSADSAVGLYENTSGALTNSVVYTDLDTSTMVINIDTARVGVNNVFNSPIELLDGYGVCMFGRYDVAIVKIANEDIGLHRITSLDPKAANYSESLGPGGSGGGTQELVKLDSTGRHFACVYAHGGTAPTEGIYMTRYR